VRVAIVGAGAIARTHLGHLEALGHEVAAVCDPVPERARALAEAAGAEAHADWRPMLEAVRMDALFVCSPPPTHAPPACVALERRIPVYLEKPLARSLADGRDIVAAWEASGCVCAVGYQWRSLDVLGRVRAELADASPGLLVSRGLGPAQRGRTGTWFEDARASGGVLFELASHDIDLQRAVAGPVVEVQAATAGGLLATAAAGSPDLADTVAVLMRFAGGGLGMVALGWTDAQQPPVYSLDVMAADVALRLDLAGPGRVRGLSHGADVDSAGVADPRRASVAHFLEAVAGAGQAVIPCSPEDALGTLRVVLAAERAVATGERIAVDGG
jgi:myo-inositol 2-dehydrogenase / D-chiro-inositol 1-dehydrogenase